MRQGKASRWCAATVSSVVILGALALGVVPPSSASTALVADYRFDDGLNSAVGTAPALIQAGSCTTPGDYATETVNGAPDRVLRFNAGCGLQLSSHGVIPRDNYTLRLLFRFADVGPSGDGYHRIFDPSPGIEDNGVYEYNTSLNFYRDNVDAGDNLGSNQLVADQYMEVAITRDAQTKLVTGYVDGVQQWSITDTYDDALITDAETPRFLVDNFTEDSSGAVARIRLYDAPLPANALVPDLLGVTMTDSPYSLKVGGGNITYTITVNNNSDPMQTATGVTLTQTLPASLRLQSARPDQGSCARQGTVLTCQLGSVAPAAAVTITVVVTPTAPEVIQSTASIHADQPDPLAGDDSSSTSTFVSDAACGKVVTKSTVLTADLGPCAVNALIVGADKITIDLGGHTIYALPGLETLDSVAGVRLPQRRGATVRNGTVTGFDAGVVLNGGSGNTVSKLYIHDNVGPPSRDADLGDGIVLFNSASNTIQSNLLVGNGNFDGIGVLGNSSSGNAIVNNTIRDTLNGPHLLGLGQGVIINSGALNENTGILLTNETVAGNVITGNNSAGIANNNVSYSSYTNNDIENNGDPVFGNDGNGIGIRYGPFARTMSQHNSISHNQIHGNVDYGIIVYTVDNSITNNDAADNGRGDPFRYDLYDWEQQFAQDGLCHNAWSNNTWGSGGFRPDCVTAHGSGPGAPHGANAGSLAAPLTTGASSPEAPQADFPTRHLSSP